MVHEPSRPALTKYWVKKHYLVGKRRVLLQLKKENKENTFLFAWAASCMHKSLEFSNYMNQYYSPRTQVSLCSSQPENTYIGDSNALLFASDSCLYV
jgi:hypothetical protein